MHGIYLVAIFLMLSQCQVHQSQTPDQDTSEATVSDADLPLADAFAALDGKWSGIFHIYEHTADQEYQNMIPEELTRDYFDRLSLTEVNQIEVQQEYHSKTAYYQTVSITDTYLENGAKKEVHSTGVNKIQNGEMWCVIQKPNEKIVHRGSSPEKDVIVWQGQSIDPFRKEYFYETVLENSYEIVGYGYYGEDDPEKNPKMWFWGKYEREE